MNALLNLESSGTLSCNFSIQYSVGLKKLCVGVYKLGVDGINITCSQ